MAENLPQKRPENALEVAVAQVPADATWQPTDDMARFLAGRLLNRRLTRRITLIRKLKLDPAAVNSWFQDPNFLEWYGERAERGDQLALDEVMGQMMARALKGDRKSAQWILENRDRRIVKRRQAAASVQAGAAAHVTVEIIPPRDAAVRECEAHIIDAKIV